MRALALAALLGLLGSPLLAGGPIAPAPAEPAVEVDVDPDGCLGCHSDPELTLELKDGTKRSLFVDPRAIGRSVHAGRASCLACHAGFEAQPHPGWDTSNASAYRARFRQACRTCHGREHGLAAAGVHGTLLAAGDTRAPSCLDCHGAHDVTGPRSPRSRISRTCGRCHGAISQAYRTSVHGKALLETANPDVPVCTDCHHAHDIADPRRRAWLLDSPEMCGRCHADPQLAARYGMSPNVLKTYVSDFHGLTVSLQREHGKGGAVTALCVDCHGIHDIKRVDDPASSAMKENLQRTCARCHTGAEASFPAAWLSHYEPTFERAPLVAGVLVFYRAFIPFVVGGLLLQVSFRAWRLVTR